MKDQERLDMIYQAAKDIATGRKMPVQKPGKSVQDVGTPDWLLALVERTWGTITYDPAASPENHACDNYDQGLPVGYDGLKEDWLSRSVTSELWEDEDGIEFNKITGQGIIWINPPYRLIAPWVQKAYESEQLVVMLVPASVGSNWWADWVHEKAAVYFLRPRLVFKGHTDPYPKDLALLVYGAESPRYRCIHVTAEDATISKGEVNEPN